MPRKKYSVRLLAQALRCGLGLSYGTALRDSKREVLFDLFDDMALSLTKEGIEHGGNSRILRYAWILGEIGDELDIPIPTKLKSQKRRRK